MDFIVAVIVFIIIWGFIASYMNNSGGTPGPRGGGEDDGYGYMSDEDADNWVPPE